MKTNEETRAGMSVIELVALIRRRSDRPVIGCADEAIAGICAIAPGPLPSDYLEWLRLAGQSPGDFMLGTDLAAPLIPRMQESMRATSRQFGGPSFPRDAFVFADHQAYVYLWFHAQGDRDRRVFRYMQMARESVEVGGSFTEVMEWTARDEYGLA
jgi:hypothetical protein